MEIDQVLKENEGFDSWGVDPAECHCVRRDPWVPCVLCGSIHCDGEVKRYRVEDSFTVENLADSGWADEEFLIYTMTQGGVENGKDED